MTEVKEHIRFVSDWLQAPQALSADEAVQLAALLQQYPYLIPLRAMEHANRVKEGSVNEAGWQQARLFSGNWIQFAEQISKAQLEQTLNNLDISDNKAATASEFSNEPELIADPEPETLFQPLFTENYFQHQGIEVSDEIPETPEAEMNSEEDSDEKSLMVMMKFEDWLQFLKKKSEVKRSEEEDRAMLRSIWQREKLAAAVGEEDDNIPEAVFEMAISSIDKDEMPVSESLAQLHIRQGHFEKAAEVYRKLSLQNPEKKTYFADKLKNLNKDHTL